MSGDVKPKRKASAVSSGRQLFIEGDPRRSALWQSWRESASTERGAGPHQELP
jgi:hypothetical protein